MGNDGKLVDVQFEHGYGVTPMAWKHMGNYGKYWKIMIGGFRGTGFSDTETLENVSASRTKQPLR